MPHSQVSILVCSEPIRTGQPTRHTDKGGTRTTIGRWASREIQHQGRLIGFLRGGSGRRLGRLVVFDYEFFATPFTPRPVQPHARLHLMRRLFLAVRAVEFSPVFVLFSVTWTLIGLIYGSRVAVMLNRHRLHPTNRSMKGLSSTLLRELAPRSVMKRPVSWAVARATIRSPLEPSAYKTPSDAVAH
jgi:hypothetical protein